MVSVLTSTLPVLLDEILFTDPLLLLMLGSRGVPGGVTICTMVLNMGATPIRRFFLISLNLSVNCKIEKIANSSNFKLDKYEPQKIHVTYTPLFHFVNKYFKH